MTKGSAVAQALALETIPSLMLGAGAGQAATAAGLAPGPSLALGGAAFALCHLLLARFSSAAAKAEAPVFTPAALAFPIDPDVETLETLLLVHQLEEPDVESIAIQQPQPEPEQAELPERPVPVGTAPAEVDFPASSGTRRSIDPDSRVVQLFDPLAGPTAGELSERIDRHLASPGSRLVPDATDELREALSALRQSLR